MGEIDGVVQQNAAGAEENAAVSEQVNTQIDQVNSMVNELAVIVSGSTFGEGGCPEPDWKAN